MNIIDIFKNTYEGVVQYIQQNEFIRSVTDIVGPFLSECLALLPIELVAIGIVAGVIELLSTKKSTETKIVKSIEIIEK